ncbi:MAG: hypothetical protein U9Q07_13385 [Planctomycetota bacterium]|nr:hypothetical protein [Planctomycetota bacterium]
MIDLTDCGCLEKYPVKALLKAIGVFAEIHPLTGLCNRLERLKVSGGINAQVGHLGFEDLEQLQVAIHQKQDHLTQIQTRQWQRRQSRLWTGRQTRGENDETDQSQKASFGYKIDQGGPTRSRRRVRRREET